MGIKVQSAGAEAIAAALAKGRVPGAGARVYAEPPRGGSEARGYWDRQRSWEGAWSAPKGYRIWIGAQGPARVRGPFTEHRGGNGTRRSAPDVVKGK